MLNPTRNQLAWSLAIFLGVAAWFLVLCLLLTTTAAILDTLRMVIDIAGIAPDLPTPVPTA